MSSSGPAASGSSSSIRPSTATIPVIMGVTILAGGLTVLVQPGGRPPLRLDRPPDPVLRRRGDGPASSVAARFARPLAGAGADRGPRPRRPLALAGTRARRFVPQPRRRSRASSVLALVAALRPTSATSSRPGRTRRSTGRCSETSPSRGRRRSRTATSSGSTSSGAISSPAPSRGPESRSWSASWGRSSRSSSAPSTAPSAGYFGGRLDGVMMRVVDVLMAVPYMFVLILFMVVFGRSILMLFIGIGLMSWLDMARIARGRNPGDQEPGVRRGGRRHRGSTLAGSSSATSFRTCSGS